MKPNVDLVFHNKTTGFGTHCIVYMEHKDIEKMKEVLSMTGIDIQLTALEYPYQTVAEDET